MTSINQFPLGWDDARVQEVIRYYEARMEDDLVEERESDLDGHTVMVVPSELVPAVEKLLAQYELENPAATATTD